MEQLMNVHRSYTSENPCIRAKSLICGTLVTIDMDRVRHMLEKGFGLECVRAGPDLLLARDRQHRPGQKRADEPFWVLEIRQKDKVPVAQEMLNHWGMAAPSQAAVDEAYKSMNERKQEFGIVRVQKPRFRHGSYACYFVDVDSNWWELEYRTAEITYEALRAKGDLHTD
jgi:hypothetical protein